MLLIQIYNNKFKDRIECNEYEYKSRWEGFELAGFLLIHVSALETSIYCIKNAFVIFVDYHE